MDKMAALKAEEEQDAQVLFLCLLNASSMFCLYGEEGGCCCSCSLLMMLLFVAAAAADDDLVIVIVRFCVFFLDSNLFFTANTQSHMVVWIGN
jgi:hypothetical protein